MKKKIILAVIVTQLIICSLMTSCLSLAGGLIQTDKMYRVTYSPPLQSVRTSIRFDGAEYLRDAEKIKAEKELREPDYSVVPTVGRIFLLLKDGNIDGANPKNSLYILKDNTGREIYRANGKDIIPDYKVSSFNGQVRTIWTAIDFFLIYDDTVEFPLFLRVVRFGDETIDITIAEKTE